MKVTIELPDGAKTLGLFITSKTNNGFDLATQWLTKPIDGMVIKFDDERNKFIVRKERNESS